MIARSRSINSLSVAALLSVCANVQTFGVAIQSKGTMSSAAHFRDWGIRTNHPPAFLDVTSALTVGHSYIPTTPSSNPLFVRLTFVPQPAVTNEATTFTASITPASSLARAILDFGDGTLADLSPLSPVNSATWEHVYTRA